jgi:hypothetical protein
MKNREISLDPENGRWYDHHTFIIPESRNIVIRVMQRVFLKFNSHNRISRDISDHIKTSILFNASKQKGLLPYEKESVVVSCNTG